MKIQPPDQFMEGGAPNNFELDALAPGSAEQWEGPCFLVLLML